MKKRILSFVITIAMLIVLPISVSAKNSIELQCASDDLPINLTTTCEFIAISDSDIGGYSFTLDVPKNISFGSLKEADGWLVSINGNKIAAAAPTSHFHTVVLKSHLCFLSEIEIIPRSKLLLPPQPNFPHVSLARTGSHSNTSFQESWE